MTLDLDEAVSADVGIVHRVDEGLAGYDHPRLAGYTATICDTEPLLGAHHDPNAGGLAPELPTARRAAVGEALERYSAAHIPASRLSRQRRAELSEPAVGPDWLGCAPADDPPVHWVGGGRLVAEHGDVRSVPTLLAASRVYLTGIDDSPALGTTTSTGLAFHSDPWSALRSGLLEVVERDAVMVSWLTRSAGREITSRLRWSESSGVRVDFDRACETYRLFRLDSPTGIPVVFAFALGAAGQPPVAVGAAADLTVARAARRALVEANQTFQWVKYMRAVRRPVPEREDVRDLDDHVAYYLAPARLTAFRHLLEQRPSIEIDLDEIEPPRPASDHVAEIVTRLHNCGFDAFAADVTSPDVREFGWAVRALIPQLYPLTIADEHRRLHPRLAGVTALNPDPHPFP
jgi:ribosomal protein S12 methylthiotransferase accessory factor